MSGIAIAGYASLDHVVTLNGVPQPGRTTTILSRPGDAWPRLGGSPAYVATALAKAGVKGAAPVSWVGDDAAGVEYREALGLQGVDDRGIAVLPGERTPVAILAYEPDGGCLCLYHPLASGELAFTDKQSQVIAEADWLCVTVGPQKATREALRLLRPDAKLCWVVKDDPRAVPPDLAVLIASRADLICCSAAEAVLVRNTFATASKRDGLILIETRGGAGAEITTATTKLFVPAEAIDVGDPTGAGDTFAGGILAALANGVTDPGAIVQSGHKAAHALLSGRAANDHQ